MSRSTKTRSFPKGTYHFKPKYAILTERGHGRTEPCHTRADPGHFQTEAVRFQKGAHHYKWKQDMQAFTRQGHDQTDPSHFRRTPDISKQDHIISESKQVMPKK